MLTSNSGFHGFVHLVCSLGRVLLGSRLQRTLLYIRGSCTVPGRKWLEEKLN